MSRKHRSSFVGFIIVVILCFIACVALFIGGIKNNIFLSGSVQEETSVITRDGMQGYLQGKYGKSFELIGDNDNVSGYYSNVSFKDEQGRKFKCVEKINSDGGVVYSDSYEVGLFTAQLNNSFYNFDANVFTVHVSVDGSDCVTELFGSLDNFLAKCKIDVYITCKQDILGSQVDICTIDTDGFVSKFVSMYPNCYSCTLEFVWHCVDASKDTSSGKYYDNVRKYIISNTDVIDFGVSRR